MDEGQLREIIFRGEDGTHQFKEMITNADSLAAEMVAFSNSQGGMIIIGVADNGDIIGLSQEQVRAVNKLIANTASNNVEPPINPFTENIAVDGGIVIVLHISNGISKPYMDNRGNIYIKNGSDKRKAASREELQRLFQQSGIVHADEIAVPTMNISDIDLNYFQKYYEKQYQVGFQEVEMWKLLQNMNLATENCLNLSGSLLFAKTPQFKLPAFIIKAMAFDGTNVDEDNYIESIDIMGKIEEQYLQTMSFAMRNIEKVQGQQGINSIGEPLIPKIVFEELIANAIIHRDYFISAPIRIFSFVDRVEIVSPGHLPNNLTIDNIKTGNSNIRNPIIASFATKIIPYRGIGSGIIRALQAHSEINFIDDRSSNIFKAIIYKR